jgi:hypothetical protein
MYNYNASVVAGWIVFTSERNNFILKMLLLSIQELEDAQEELEKLNEGQEVSDDDEKPKKGKAKKNKKDAADDDEEEDSNKAKGKSKGKKDKKVSNLHFLLFLWAAAEPGS